MFAPDLVPETSTSVMISKDGQLDGVASQYLLGTFRCSPPEPFSFGQPTRLDLIQSSEQHGKMYTGSTKKRLAEHAVVHKSAYLHNR